MDFVETIAGGHVVADLVVREGKDNTEFGTFRIAVNQFAGTQDTAAYYDCVAPEHVLQSMQKAGVKKGSSIMVAGAQTLRSYVGKDKIEKTSVCLRVMDWKYIGTKPKGEEQPVREEEHHSSEPAAHNAAAGGHTGRSNIRPAVNLQDEDDLPV